MFVEDVPPPAGRPVQAHARQSGATPRTRAQALANASVRLFDNMRVGGSFGLEHILHFNGGLFDNDEALAQFRN
jgi:hypothetical protein